VKKRITLLSRENNTLPAAHPYLTPVIGFLLAVLLDPELAPPTTNEMEA
jgi:hypothetical protein